MENSGVHAYTLGIWWVVNSATSGAHTWVQILALSTLGWEPWASLLDPLSPSFFLQKMEIIIVPSSQDHCEREMSLSSIKGLEQYLLLSKCYVSICSYLFFGHLRSIIDNAFAKASSELCIFFIWYVFYHLISVFHLRDKFTDCI